MEKFEGFPLDKQTWDFPTIINGWVHRLSGAEFKVLWYIVRHTYGWQKTGDKISYKQFQHGIQKQDGTWLDKGTGLGTRAIAYSLKRLEEKGFIERISDPRSGRVGFYKLRFARTPTYAKMKDPCLKMKDPPCKNERGTHAKMKDTIPNIQSLTRQSLSPEGCQKIRNLPPETRERLFSRFRKTFPKSSFSDSFLEENEEKIDYLLYLIEKGEILPGSIKSPRAYLKSLTVDERFPSFPERHQKPSSPPQREDQQWTEIDIERNKKKIKTIIEHLKKRDKL